MRRGQTTLEYILIIGFVAAGIIAMLVYVSRGHQGRLRSQAEQLGAQQYAPGNTIINNSETKTLGSTAGAGSSTTTTLSDHPVGETIPGLDLALQGVYDAYGDIYLLRGQWEKAVVDEAKTGAADVRAGNFNWTPPANGISLYETQLNDADTALTDANTAVDTAIGLYPERDPNKTTSTSWSSESGKTVTHKQISETLGNL